MNVTWLSMVMSGYDSFKRIMVMLFTSGYMKNL